MLMIRLQRVGRKNDPHFRVVVIDRRRASKAGSVSEIVGSYSPAQKILSLKGDRINYWISVGAKPSNTVHNLLIKEKIIEGNKIHVGKKSKKKKGAEETKPAEKATPTETTEKPASTKKEEEPAQEAPKEEKSK